MGEVLRVPLVDGVAWFKACAPVQAFEPRLTAELYLPAAARARFDTPFAIVLRRALAVTREER